MRSARPPVATFFVRVWYEEGQFRARTSRSRAGDDRPRVELTADAASVVALLRQWLEELDAERAGREE